MTPIDRRTFLSAALIGLLPKSGRTIAGGFVNEAQTLGHQLRDRTAFPVATETRRATVVIVGGGIAGLSAAWRLAKKGFTDFVLLEMESEAGGNARSGRNEVSAYPWAAHYVPLPAASASLVRELFTDLGLFDGREWNERHLVHAPKERLFIHGRWQEGLEPQVGPTERERDQLARFEDRMRAFAATGRFTIPMAVGMQTAAREDTLTMRAWMDREGFDSPWLGWLVDYACRDDYGALSRDVSAWAGIHYYAARDLDEAGPLTWPEGNGWIVKRLLERVGTHVHTGSVVHSITRDGQRWRVLTPATTWIADAVIVASPLLVASRIVDGLSPAGVTYSPWLTANLTLDRWPASRGFEVAWDNVMFDSPSLGYVVATNQELRRFVPHTVWTYYWALAHDTPAVARRWLLAQDWSTLKDRILSDLSRAHPDVADCVARVDIMRHGHAMIRPTPGFLSTAADRDLTSAKDRLFYAHSDASGIPIFEEAQYRGVKAADGVMQALR